MTYSGQVTVGGPADVHELKDLMITKIAVGPMDNNAYLLRCRATDEQLLIDAANDADTLLGTIGDDGIASVVTTHQHGDHWQALAAVVEATGARTYAGREDADEPTITVRGTGPDLLGWLAGRRTGSALTVEGGTLPSLPPL